MKHLAYVTSSANKHILSDAGISVGDNVGVEATAGVITISQVKSPRKKISLQELVDQIPEGYDPTEIDWGEPLGKEAW